MGNHDNFFEHVLFAAAVILFAIWIAHATWVRLDRIEDKVDHIDTHFQVPEPTPRTDRG